MTLQLLHKLLPPPLYERELPAGERMPLFQKAAPEPAIQIWGKGDTGYSGKRVYLLRAGLLRIVRRMNTLPARTRYFVKSPQVFGELALVGREKEYDFAEALRHSCISVFPAAAVKRQLLEHADLSQYFWTLSARRLSFIRQQLNFFPDMDLPQRILTFMATYVREITDDEHFPLQAENFLTLQDLAFYNRASLAEVKQAVQQLEKEGKLIYAEEKIIIFSV